MSNEYKNPWMEGFLGKGIQGSYLRYWSSIIIYDKSPEGITNPTRKLGGWPEIGDLFMVAKEVLQEENAKDLI